MTMTNEDDNNFYSLRQKNNNNNLKKIIITRTRTLREHKPPPTSKFETKVIQDSNPDFRINSYPDPDVYRICPKMLWCYGCIILSASVISPNVVQISRLLY